MRDYQEWDSEYQDYLEPEPQENTVSDVTQENPVVSKLREAFDTAVGAIIEGTELAKIVGDLRKQVDALSANVSILERDLEYVRNRNRELDEQVTQVRRARDEAIQEASQLRQEVTSLTNDRDGALNERNDLQARVTMLHDDLTLAHMERDEVKAKANELEKALNDAQAKLASIEEMFKPKDVPVPLASTTAWPSQSQPRDPVTQQWKSPYESGSQGSY